MKNATTAYLLKSITNEYGGVTLLNYTDSTQYNNSGNDSLSDIGFNVNVVKSVTQNNSMRAPFSVLSLSNYTYKGGKYDYSSSEFRGFNIVNETKADNTKAVHYFLQDDALKGKEYKTEVYGADGTIYSKEQNLYRSVLNNSYYKIYLDVTSSTDYDNNAKAKEVNTSYTYNTYGDVSRKLYHGDTNVSGDEKWEDYVYFYNTSNWIMGKVRRYLLQDNSSIAKVSWYSYDNGVNTAPQSKGELTRVENWLSLAAVRD